MRGGGGSRGSVFLQDQELNFVEETSLLGIMINNRYLGLHKLPQSAVKSEERFVPLLNKQTNKQTEIFIRKSWETALQNDQL